MFDTVNGLPAHPLIIHATLGFVALAALLGIVAAVVPRWRGRLLPWSALVGVVAAVTTVVATQSGEALQRRVPATGLIGRHAELGEQTRTIALGLAVLLVLWWLVDRAARRGGVLRVVAAVLAVASAVVALTSGVWLYRTGEAGARAVWQNTPRPNQVDHGPGPQDASGQNSVRADSLSVPRR